MEFSRASRRISSRLDLSTGGLPGRVCAYVQCPRWATSVVVIGLFVVHVGVVALAEEKFPTVPLLFGVLVWGGAGVIGDPFAYAGSGW